jgi:hypothetical protein
LVNQNPKQEMMTMDSKLELVGTVSVDTGRIYIGDPCYTGRFLTEDYLAQTVDEQVVQFEGGPGVVSVHTGFGDGSYPVFVQRTESGHIKSVTIEFIKEDDDHE